MIFVNGEYNQTLKSRPWWYVPRSQRYKIEFVQHALVSGITINLEVCR